MAPLHLAVQGQDGGGQVRRRCDGSPQVPELHASVVHELVLLSCVDLWLVLVHGGEPEINSVLERIDVNPQLHNSLPEINSVLERIGVKPQLRNSFHPPWPCFSRRMLSWLTGVVGIAYRLPDVTLYLPAQEGPMKITR